MCTRDTLPRADAELIDLLTALRPDWTPASIRQAISARDHAGHPWSLTMRALIRLAEYPTAQPGHLSTLHT